LYAESFSQFFQLLLGIAQSFGAYAFGTWPTANSISGHFTFGDWKAALY